MAPLNVHEVAPVQLVRPVIVIFPDITNAQMVALIVQAPAVIKKLPEKVIPVVQFMVRVPVMVMAFDKVYVCEVPPRRRPPDKLATIVRVHVVTVIKSPVPEFVVPEAIVTVLVVVSVLVQVNVWVYPVVFKTAQAEAASMVQLGEPESRLAVSPAIA